MIMAELPDDGGPSPATLLEQHGIADEYMKAPPSIEIMQNGELSYDNQCFSNI